LAGEGAESAAAALSGLVGRFSLSDRYAGAAAMTEWALVAIIGMVLLFLYKLATMKDDE
jgi:hypothetical protein